MKNFTEELGITGHLVISKRDKSTGNEEVIFDDHNVIVSGMGVGLSYLFTGSGSNSIVDYQIDRFQLGTSGDAVLEVSSTYQLSSNLTFDEYGSEANSYIKESEQLVNGAVATNAFALVPASKVTRVDDTSVRYTLVVDEEMANVSDELNEVGLFMKNPTGQTDDRSILVAYRSFSDILKTTDFSLIFRWSINF
tara:strand:+ start:769 stop:1350 length:582 start_codon:yes stop_codon:yes gene_type:complete